MYEFLAIISFWLIGVPGIVYLFLNLRAAERRRALAYEWNSSELERRQLRLQQMEVQAGEIRRKIGELMLEKSRLDAQAGKLQNIIDERQTGGTAPAA
jgi:hypothetical protein